MGVLGQNKTITEAGRLHTYLTLSILFLKLQFHDLLMLAGRSSLASCILFLNQRSHTIVTMLRMFIFDMRRQSSIRTVCLSAKLYNTYEISQQLFASMRSLHIIIIIQRLQWKVNKSVFNLIYGVMFSIVNLQISIGMQMIKKISEFLYTAAGLPSLTLKKKTTSYKPVSRIERINHSLTRYPTSSQAKFIFISSLDGVGFQRQIYPTCPSSIYLDQMLDQLNRVCYKQWELDRQHQSKRPFQKLDKITNFMFKLSIFITSIVFLLFVSIDLAKFMENLIGFSFFAFFLVLINLMLPLIGCFWPLQPFDPQKNMINAIKSTLSTFNEDQKRENQPRFSWTCHSDCIWIAIEIYNMTQIF